MGHRQVQRRAPQRSRSVGHAGCTSGLQLEWQNFEQYYINEELQATPVIAGERTVLGA